MKKLSKVIGSKVLLFSLLSSLFLLSGCNESDKKDDTMIVPPPPPIIYSYEISVTNLTQAQPMSPIAVMLHNDGHFWQVGESASNALEKLAESGDNGELLDDSIILEGKSGAGVLPAGMSETIMIDIQDNIPTKLSLATMLVNSNDAFTGINALTLENLAVNESISVFTNSYDAGTEKNSELKSTIPGPAGGGEGFNNARDDVDFVAMHSGIVSQDDGLTQSVLTQAHRFDNPTLKVVISRIK